MAHRQGFTPSNEHKFVEHEYKQKENFVSSPDLSKTTDMSAWRAGLNVARHYLGNRWIVLALGSLVIMMGAVLNWSWLVAIGIAPILLALAPCVVMCALGLCAMKMKRNPK